MNTGYAFEWTGAELGWGARANDEAWDTVIVGERDVFDAVPMGHTVIDGARCGVWHCLDGKVRAQTV